MKFLVIAIISNVLANIVLKMEFGSIIKFGLGFKHLIAIGFMGISFVGYSFSIDQIGLARTNIIHVLTSMVLVVLISAIFFNEDISRMQSLYLLICLISIMLFFNES